MTMASMRDNLDRLGLCPTAQGLEMAEREVDDLRAGIVEGLDYLTAGDLFTVYVIVADLSQAAQRAHDDTCQVAQLMELAGDALTAALEADPASFLDLGELDNVAAELAAA